MATFPTRRAAAKQRRRTESAMGAIAFVAKPCDCRAGYGNDSFGHWEMAGSLANTGSA